MVILVLDEEMDQALGMTLGVLNSCGFKTKVLHERELRMLSTERTILIGKHPKKKHNGTNQHRRRFVFHRCHGFRSVGYAEGADREIDSLWWRDLYYKLRSLLWEEPESERLDLIIPLARLKKLGNQPFGQGDF